MIDTLNLKESLAIAESIVEGARQHLLSIPRSELQVQKKADRSFVTRADRETEIYIREQLTHHFPDHGILGEEFPAVNTDSPYTWIIDPIDGTHSFMHNIPLYGILLCLTEGEKGILSIIDLPAIDRRYAAAVGCGATCNGTPVQIMDVADEEEIRYQVIGTGERRSFLSCNREDVFDKMLHDHAHVRTYCDCFGHALAAEGVLGAMLDFNVRIWDCASTIVLVEEAGGKAVCLGERQDGEHKRYDWIFGKPSMVDWIINSYVK